MGMTDEEFDAYYDFCIEQLDVKQERLYDEYGVGTFEDYIFNQEDGVLQFKVDDEEVLAFEVVLIGSLSLNSATWMWAWANESVKEALRKKSMVLKEIKGITGYEVFENPQFDCDEMMAEGLAAFSLEQLRAKGMYVVPTDNRYVYLALLHTVDR